jgi:hypothetical protein
MALLSPGPGTLLVARWLVALGCTAAPVLPARAQTSPAAPEQAVKAAYLLNFTRYVDWPAGTFADADAPVNLCVLGENAFGGVVRQSVQGRRSRGRPIRVLEPDAPAQTGDCHIAFVAGRSREARAWLAALRHSPTLTVGDGPEFLGIGGMVAFVLVDETLRFEIDAGAVRHAGLQISSRVLALAMSVSGEPAEAR